MKNLDRHLKAFKKRATEQATKKLEILAAAFLKETGLKPSQARLCQATGLKNGQPVVELWFEHLPDRANLSDTHDDVKYMFDLLFSINEFFKDKTLATLTDDHKIEITGWLEMVSDLMQKYADATATPVGVKG